MLCSKALMLWIQRKKGATEESVHIVFLKQPLAILLLAEGMASTGLKCRVFRNTSAGVGSGGQLPLGRESGQKVLWLYAKY